MSLCSPVEGRSLRGRFSISNDLLKLRGIDGRSRGGRRYRDLMRAYAAELGGIASVSEPQRALCAQAATLTVQVEALQSRVIAGDVIDPDLIVRTSNVQLRALAALGLKKGPRLLEGPRLLVPLGAVGAKALQALRRARLVEAGEGDRFAAGVDAVHQRLVGSQQGLGPAMRDRVWDRTSSSIINTSDNKKI